MIRIHQLTKYYNGNCALDRISFEVAKGEIVGFLGPNGAGKTTTLRIMTCFLAPTDGDMRVNGFDIYDSPIEVKSSIGYLPENNPLYPEMSVYEYLLFIARMRSIPPSRISTAIGNAVSLCGLEQVYSRKIEELSRGYRQRVGLAQAIIHNPPILILDEPTTGLDPNQIAEIRELIRQLGREKTVIISSHILPEIQAVCSRIIIINRGRIVADGPTRDIGSMVNQKNIVQIMVRGPREQVLGALKTIPDIAHAKLEGENEDGLSIACENMPGRDSREAIFKTIASQGWVLTEMRQTGLSFEEIFRALTHNGDNA